MADKPSPVYFVADNPQKTKLAQVPVSANRSKTELDFVFVRFNPRLDGRILMLMQRIQKSLVAFFVCLGIFYIAYETELSASMTEQIACIFWVKK